jgi:TIR domain
MSILTKADLARVNLVFHKNKTLSESIRLDSEEFTTFKNYDIFLSHSYSDKEDLLKIKQLLKEAGFTTYVDWIEDRQLPRSQVNKSTAKLLKERMQQCKALFYITSSNSSSSKWMPWELGYFDGLKKSRVAILPILEESTSYNGQEYLGLYPYVDRTDSKFYIQDDIGVWVRLDEWLGGKEPQHH